jgi:hypothetical protein
MLSVHHHITATLNCVNLLPDSHGQLSAAVVW